MLSAIMSVNAHEDQDGGSAVEFTGGFVCQCNNLGLCSYSTEEFQPSALVSLLNGGRRVDSGATAQGLGKFIVNVELPKPGTIKSEFHNSKAVKLAKTIKTTRIL